MSRAPYSASQADAKILVDGLDWQWSDPASPRVLIVIASQLLADGWLDEDVTELLEDVVRVLRF